MRPVRAARLIFLFWLLVACVDTGIDRSLLASARGPLLLDWSPRGAQDGTRPELWLRFDMAVDPGSLSGSLFLAEGCTGQPAEDLLDLLEDGTIRTVAASLSTGDEGRLVLLDPQQPLAAESAYSVVLSTGLCGPDRRPFAIARSTPAGDLDYVVSTPFAFCFSTGIGPLAVVATYPQASQTGVPVGLAAVEIRFSEPLAAAVDPAGFVRLEAGDGSPVGLAAVEVENEAGAGTVRLFPAAELALAARYAIRVEPGPVGSVSGHTLDRPFAAGFETAAERDSSPPSLVSIEVEPLDTTAVVRVAFDEPVRAGIECEAHTAEGGGFSSSCELLLEGLPPDTLFACRWSATDPSGNRAGGEVAFATIPRLPRLAITEVMANPACSPENGCEYVEVLNLGPETVETAGLLLDDRRDGASIDRVAGSVSIPPGGQFLIAGGSFSGVVGCPLTLLGDGSIGRSGLAVDASIGLYIERNDGIYELSSYGSGESGWLKDVPDGRSVERSDPSGPNGADDWVVSAEAGGTPCR